MHVTERSRISLVRPALVCNGVSTSVELRGRRRTNVSLTGYDAMPISPIQLAAFAQRLRSLRRAYARAIDLPELAGAEFARMVGISAASYEAYESAEQEPTLSALALLHRKTGVSLDWLIADDSERRATGSPAGRSRAEPVPPPG